MARSDKVRAFRHAAFVLAQHAGIPRLQRFTVVLNWRPPTNRRRDVENYFATVKPCVDGIVDAGVAPDDTPEFYVSSTPVLHKAIKGDPGRIWLTVIDLSDQPGDKTLRENPYCTRCGDERGGPYGHETNECTWNRKDQK